MSMDGTYGFNSRLARALIDLVALFGLRPPLQLAALDAGRWPLAAAAGRDSERRRRARRPALCT